MHRRSRGRLWLPAGLALLVAVAALAAGCGSSSTPPLPQIQPAVVTPPAGAVVDAVEWGTRDLAIARTPGTATVQVVDGQGHGVDGLRVTIDGRASAGCGTGCYRAKAGAGAVAVGIGARTWHFDVPASAPAARGRVAAAMRAYSRLHSVALDESLASGPTGGIRTSFVFAAPDRLSYAIRGGSQAIVIGSRRWDRPSADAPWTSSAQQRILVMHLAWDRAIDAHLVGPNTITFFDPRAHAWFRVVVDPRTSLPRTVHMTGIAHFMVDRYSRWNVPATIVPPR